MRNRPFWILIVDDNIPKATVRDSNTPLSIDKEAAKKNNSAFYLEKFRILRKETKALINRKLKEYNISLGDSLKVKPNQTLYQLMLRTEGDRSPMEWRYVYACA